MMQVCVLTSVHTVWDTRIYHRQAKSLAQAGYKVTLVATDVKSQTPCDNIRIVGLERPKRRIGRALNWLPFIKAALKTEADIYHFHDPDLLFAGFILQKYTGRPVIYDCHEPYEIKILEKYWLPRFTRSPISFAYGVLERWCVNRLSAIIVPTEGQLLRYPEAIVVRNMPWRHLALPQPRQKLNRHQAVYVGVINEVRGVWNMLQALNRVSFLDAELTLIGRIDTHRLEQEMKAYIHTHRLNQRVKLMGPQPYETIPRHLATATVGLINFEDTPSLQIGIPTKLFEYMALGLPVIASDLPPIRPFVEQAECGLLVAPSDISGLTDALEYIFAHPADAWQFGENGRQAIIDRYNWEVEEQKLLSLYQELLH